MISVLNNGVWSKWSFTQIKGEKGDKGDDGSSGKSYMTIRYYASVEESPDICTSFDCLDNKDSIWSQDYSKIYNTYISNFKSENPHKMFASSAVLEYDYSADNVISLKSMSDPEEITTTVNQGENGKIVYYMGSYQDWHEAGGKEDIICTATSAPYFTDVHNEVSRNYIYNSQVSWKDVLSQYHITNATLYGALYDLENLGIKRDQYWIEMNTNKVFLTEIGIIQNGTVGSAVFNDNVVFSKHGTSNNIGDEETAFKEFEYIDDLYGDNQKFKPSWLLDSKTGNIYANCGATAFTSNSTSIGSNSVTIGSQNEDGLSMSIINNSFSLKYKECELTLGVDGIKMQYKTNGKAYGITIDSTGYYVSDGENTRAIGEYVDQRMADSTDSGTLVKERTVSTVPASGSNPKTTIGNITTNGFNVEHLEHVSSINGSAILDISSEYLVHELVEKVSVINGSVLETVFDGDVTKPARIQSVSGYTSSVGVNYTGNAISVTPIPGMTIPEGHTERLTVVVAGDYISKDIEINLTVQFGGTPPANYSL